MQRAHGIEQAGAADKAAARLEPVQLRARGFPIAGGDGAQDRLSLLRQFRHEQSAQRAHCGDIAAQGLQRARIVPDRRFAIVHCRDRAERASDRSVQHDDSQRFLQHFGEACCLQSVQALPLHLGGQAQRGDAGTQYAQIVQELLSARVRQVRVEQPQGVGMFAREGQRIGGIVRGIHDGRRQRFQRMVQETTTDRVVLDQQQALGVHRDRDGWHTADSMLRAPNLRNHETRVHALSPGIALLLALPLSTPLQARTLELHADSLHSDVATANGLRVQLDWPDAAASGSLRIDAATVDAAAYGYRFVNVHWECPLTRDAREGWRCDGNVRTGNAKPMRLTLAIAPASTTARLSDGRSAVGLQRLAATPDNTRLLFEQVPAAWLQAYTATLWTDGKLQKGTLAGRLDIRVPARGPVVVQGPLLLRGLALETPDGGIAVGSLDADLQFDYSQNATLRNLGADITMHGGELLVGGLYATLPKTPVVATIRANQAGRGDWIFPTLRWNDGAVLTANGDARYSPAFDLRALNLKLRSDDLAHARDRYLTGWLGQAGFADLQLRGGLQAEFAMAAGGLQGAHAQLIGVDAIDGKQRFVLHGLDGDLRWTADAAAVASALRWSSGALFGIALGPTRVALHSQSRKLQLDGTAEIPLLGGTLRLDKFDLTAPDKGNGSRFVLGLTLLKLQVAQLAKALDWPAFGGTLDGTLPAARYENGVLNFDGGLVAQVFGGTLSVGKLAMERPFGADPSVNADVAIKGFDLKALTGVFGFGEITGRLDGHIRDLRLLDWSPVAFDAELHSDGNAPDRRRISQRAIADLSNVGGGGFVGGLQAQALKIFQDFGYARLGLSCKLANNVCHMDGVGSAGAGYTIVEGSGLPHISVVGFAREVDWPTLVARLQAATQGKIIIK